MTDTDRSRRLLIRQCVFGIAAAPLSALIPLAARRAVAAESLPLLAEDDPEAKAQGYVADASRATGAQSGALCANCSVYGGADGADAGPCTVFPNRFVKAAGWCKAWSGL